MIFETASIDEIKYYTQMFASSKRGRINRYFRTHKILRIIPKDIFLPISIIPKELFDVFFNSFAEKKKYKNYNIYWDENDQYFCMSKN